MNEKIVFRTGILVGQEFPLSGEEITIGRDLDNHVVLDDVQVSRKHLRIYRKDTVWMIEDLKSTNGTVLNGKTIKKAQKLKNGDVIAAGENNIFEFQVSGEESDAYSEEGQVLLAKQEKPSIKDDKAELEKVESLPKESKSEGKTKVKITDKYPTWAIVLMIALAFIIVFCVIPLVIIEVTNQWCNLFSGFFNSIQPGICP